ncbi:hypothetical protein [Streptomyces aculeolatus]|nr:hypothetical protein [Streptomyces aculeolatus]
MALTTAAFAIFVADYADRRSYLMRASRELNLTRRWRCESVTARR